MTLGAKEKILNAAEALISVNGYHGTGTNAIIAEAGVSKGSFFYHFPDKASLLRALLPRYFEQAHWEPLQVALQEKAHPRDALLLYLDQLEDWQLRSGHAGGCLLGNLSLELSDSDDGLREVAMELFERWREALESMLLEVPTTMPVPQLSVLVIALIEGVTMTTRVARDPDRTRLEFEACRALLRQCIERPSIP
ncbi:MAG: TetR/AcrR family transcriptional regulator [Acidobacteriota bacterium]